MKVVVTGGAGFIGSTLARRLVAEADVHVVDDLSSGRAENVPKEATLHRGSILDPKLLAEVFRGASHVYHLAALASVPRSIRDPVRSHETNATGTLRVLVAARDAGVEKVVYAGSSSAYGASNAFPKREEMPVDPQNPYAVAKLAGEHYCRAFGASYGLRTTTLRYFNVYGPRQDPQGEYAAVVARWVDAALRGAPLVVHGDGSQTRDFTAVADAVRATALAASSSRSDGLTVNVPGSGETRLLDLASRILALSGSRSVVERGPPRPGDVARSFADPSRAREVLGYVPSVSLEEGLKATIAWFRESR